ncbi:EamA family transporter [Chloroflexota bacterium]
MDWVGTALLSAAIYGVVNIIDSHLLTRRMPGFRALILPIGIIHFIYSGVALSLFPLPDGTDIWLIAAALASSLLRTAAVSTMLYMMKKVEVAQVVPIVYTYPIFVAILAMPLLGESLYYLEWLAIFVVVAGAVVVSFRRGQSGSITWRARPLLMLLGCSLLLALADITSKYVLGFLSFWNMFWLGGFCMSTVFILVSMRPQILRQLGNMQRKKSTIAILALNEMLAPTAMLLMYLAIERGPVSLVSTVVGSSRPVFVFILALVVSRILPRFIEWHADRRLLITRFVAVAMIAAGILIIQLG